jgi:Ni/Co efflux regulator RcnB
MKTLKKIVLSAIAASVVAVPVAAEAAPHGRNDDNRGRVERVETTRIVQRNNGRQVVKVKQVRRDDRPSYRSFRKGERFDSRYARNYRVIDNPRAYRLNDAPRGYRWVQSGNDAVMVAIASGIIGAVLGSRF